MWLFGFKFVNKKRGGDVSGGMLMPTSWRSLPWQQQLLVLITGGLSPVQESCCSCTKWAAWSLQQHPASSYSLILCSRGVHRTVPMMWFHPLTAHGVQSHHSGEPQVSLGLAHRLWGAGQMDVAMFWCLQALWGSGSGSFPAQWP